MGAVGHRGNRMGGRKRSVQPSSAKNGQRALALRQGKEPRGGSQGKRIMPRKKGEMAILGLGVTVQGGYEEAVGIDGHYQNNIKGER